MKRRRRWLIPLTIIVALLGLVQIAGAARPPAQIIGHRGAVAHAPENTLPAFEKALALGVHGVECDILVTADGAVVLSHDGTIDRCSDGTGRVGDMTLAQLRERDFGSWFSEDFTGTQIPTLGEFLDTVRSADLILVELKTNEGDIAAKAVEAVRARGLMAKTVFQSFDMDAIQACKRADAAAAIALLYGPGGDYDKAVRADAAGFCKRYNLDALHPQYAALSSGIARRCGKIGVDLRTWTANDRLFLAGGSGQGARGLITDNIELAQKMMRLPAFVRRLYALACDMAFLIAPYWG